MIWALIFAALAAVAVVATTRMVLLRTKELTTAQDDLGKAKDNQLTLDLRDKDVKIAEAQHGVVDAKNSASALSIELESEKQKTARFQKEADEARLALEKRVRNSGTTIFLIAYCGFQFSNRIEQILRSTGRPPDLWDVQDRA